MEAYDIHIQIQWQHIDWLSNINDYIKIGGMNWRHELAA